MISPESVNVWLTSRDCHFHTHNWFFKKSSWQLWNTQSFSPLFPTQRINRFPTEHISLGLPGVIHSLHHLHTSSSSSSKHFLFFLSFKPLLPLILVIQSCLMPRRSITFVFPFKAVYLVGSSFCWPTQFTFCWACWSRTVWVLPSVFALCVYSPFVSSPLPPLLICSGAGKLQCTERIYNHITYCTKI